MTAIAIVGQGYMGRTHAEAWASLGYADRIRYLVAPGTRALFEPAASARFVNDLQVALDDPEVDILSVCTPTPSHAEIAIRALRAGKHVLLEKPIALTLDDSLAIREVAATSGRILMIAQVVRFFAGYQLLREAWQDGSLGTLQSLRAVRAINTPTWADWWADETQSGGVPVDFSIHDYDQANLFLGTPVAVTATRLTDEGPIETTIEYRDGGVAQVLSHAHTAVGLPFTSSLAVIGTKGMADYRLTAGSPTDPDASGVNSFRLTTVSGSNEVGVADNAPYAREAEYFLDCVTSGREPTLSPTDSAIRALEVSLGARESLQQRTRVELHSRLDG